MWDAEKGIYGTNRGKNKDHERNLSLLVLRSIINVSYNKELIMYGKLI